MWVVDYAYMEEWLDSQDEDTVAHVFALRLSCWSSEVLLWAGPWSIRLEGLAWQTSKNFVRLLRGLRR